MNNFVWEKTDASVDEAAARRAAEKWFRETRNYIEENRGRTGGSFADAAIANLDAAVEKLAGIILSEMKESK